MKLSHFHAFKPLCPLCRVLNRGDFPLHISFAAEQTDSSIQNGVLVCSNPQCQCEYPVIDGIPYIFPDIRKYLNEHHLSILLRDDLPIEMLNILHESAGAGSWLSSHRQHLSSYMHDHYSGAGVLAGGNRPACAGGFPIADEGVGATCNLINHALHLANNPRPDKALEIGCCVGGGAFQIARDAGALTLGIDVNPLFLRKAHQILKTGRAVYDLRRSGLLYERQEIAFESPTADRVDFWAADALALPFADQTIPCVFALNVIDCVASPVGMLNEIIRVMRSMAAICSPWDWTGGVTPEENWIGGHSPRANFQGNSMEILQSLLPPRIKMIAQEKNIPWRVRMHDKHVACYQTDLMVIGME